MRETIEKLLKYIEDNCIKGRDDLEIAGLYSAVSALYGAIEAIKIIEERTYAEHDCKRCMYDCSECEFNNGDVDT